MQRRTECAVLYLCSSRNYTLENQAVGVHSNGNDIEWEMRKLKKSFCLLFALF